jgi:hypothetical protein
MQFHTVCTMVFKLGFRRMGAVNLQSWPDAYVPSVGEVNASADPDDSVILATAIAAEPI